MTQNLRTLLPWLNRQGVHYECRKCGTTVDVSTDECPMCGSTRIARYEIVAADWMGTRHLSALEASTRPQVIWAITLSEEDGRVTTFLDGTYKDYEREELGGRWRPE